MKIWYNFVIQLCLIKDFVSVYCLFYYLNLF